VKNVQGEYITFFESNIAFLLHIIFKNSNNDKKKILEIFKTWDALELFPRETLLDIIERLNLRALEQ